jgi:hypothetical protein
LVFTVGLDVEFELEPATDPELDVVEVLVLVFTVGLDVAFELDPETEPDSAFELVVLVLFRVGFELDMPTPVPTPFEAEFELVVLVLVKVGSELAVPTPLPTPTDEEPEPESAVCDQDGEPVPIAMIATAAQNLFTSIYPLGCRQPSLTEIFRGEGCRPSRTTARLNKPTRTLQRQNWQSCRRRVPRHGPNQ